MGTAPTIDVTARVTNVATLADGTQVLVTTYDGGESMTVATRPHASATWGRPVEAVAR